MSFLRIFDLGRRKVKKRLLVQKRNEFRARTHNVMKVTSVNETRKEYVSNLIDISESGIQFLSHHKFEVGHKLEIVINFPQKKIEIPVFAKVMWIKPGQRKHWGYRVGAAFTDVNPRDKTLIGEFILETRAKHGKDALMSSDG